MTDLRSKVKLMPLPELQLLRAHLEDMQTEHEWGSLEWRNLENEIEDVRREMANR